MDDPIKFDHAGAESYIKNRWEDQVAYFDSKAKTNQKLFILTRRIGFFAGLITPIVIFVVVALSVDASNTSRLVHYYHVIPAVLSLVAVGSYQWEELHSYGAQWAKFRLVSEKLKGHKELYQQRAGYYGSMDESEALKKFVEACEGLIEGTDVNYFVLMVDPLRRQVG